MADDDDDEEDVDDPKGRCRENCLWCVMFVALIGLTLVSVLLLEKLKIDSEQTERYEFDDTICPVQELPANLLAEGV